MSGKKAVHFGGGNIGRGFVAEFLHKSGYEVVFLDVIEELVTNLQNIKHYKVTEIGTEGTTTNEITNYRALHSLKNGDQAVEEIRTADIVTCAVGPTILPRIANPIAKGISGRTKDTPLAVIACENMKGGTDALKKEIIKHLDDKIKADLPNYARFGNSAIDRIVPLQDVPTKEEDKLNVKIEKFHEWCVDENDFKSAKGGIPKIEGVHWVSDLEPYIERKLYTVNTAHATAAYYGHNRGKRTVQDVMEDPELSKIVRQAVEESSHYIIQRYKIPENEQKEYRETILKRISNKALEDVVERVGRAPLRKLGKEERFIGPAYHLAEMGAPHDALMGGIEMCLRFQNVEGDEESDKLATLMKEKSAKDLVTELCGLEPSNKLFPSVEKLIAKVQGK